jgi:hypothetical protein
MADRWDSPCRKVTQMNLLQVIRQSILWVRRKWNLLGFIPSPLSEANDDVASKMWTGVQTIFVPRIRILSRRDYRTQPGVLTPGTDKKGTRPEGGGREAFSALDAERDPQRISAAPFLLRPLFPELWRTGRAGPIVNVSWG